MDLLVFLSEEISDLRQIILLHAIGNALAFVCVGITTLGKGSVIEFTTTSKRPEEFPLLLFVGIYPVLECLAHLSIPLCFHVLFQCFQCHTACCRYEVRICPQAW